MRNIFVNILLLYCLFCPRDSCVLAEWSEPVNIGTPINTSGFDYYPCISYDGKKLFFSSRSRAGGYGEDDIWVSEWNGSEWGTPANLGPNINTFQRELSPSISADGSKLYFVTYGRPGGYGWYDIYVSTWQGSTWGPAENVGPNVNTEGMEWSVCISADEMELYFTSDKRPGNYGWFDTWVSRWDGDGWGPAENLGPLVNSGSDDEDPCISADGNSLYFASFDTDFIRQQADIFVCHRDSSGEWGPKERLSVNGVADSNDTPPIVSGWDLGPSISSDGKRLFFSSRRHGGVSFPADDIWVSEWIETDVSSEEVDDRLPTEFFLGQCYPNPFNPATTIEYSIAGSRSSVNVTLEIYDILGCRVKTLINGYQDAGFYRETWDGRNDKGDTVPSGIYFYRLDAGNFEETKKMSLIR